MMPTVTKNLIIINVLVFFRDNRSPTLRPGFNELSGNYIFSLQVTLIRHSLSLICLCTADSATCFFNMFAVFMFGPILEQTWGPKRFLFYYILCGIGAGLIQEGVQYIQYVTELSHYAQVNIGTGVIPMEEYLNMMTTVGASGAVYAILLAFGMLFPNNRLFIFPLPFPIKAKFFVIGYAAIELWSGLANSAGDNVAHFAHLGGMLFGLILILYWRKKSNNNGTYYS